MSGQAGGRGEAGQRFTSAQNQSKSFPCVCSIRCIFKRGSIVLDMLYLLSAGVTREITGGFNTRTSNSFMGKMIDLIDWTDLC